MTAAIIMRGVLVETNSIGCVTMHDCTVTHHLLLGRKSDEKIFLVTPTNSCVTSGSRYHLVVILFDPFEPNRTSVRALGSPPVLFLLIAKNQ